MQQQIWSRLIIANHDAFGGLNLTVTMMGTGMVKKKVSSFEAFPILFRSVIRKKARKLEFL
jgi:hypothetical protein